MSPRVEGFPIKIEFAPQLRAHAGKLVVGSAQPGREVHAGTFLRQRRIVLDAALKGQTTELTRILVHELFHFVWLRLGNPKRRSFEDLLRRELRERARGELGWSAELLKIGLNRHDSAQRTRRWREYACESFCDTAAWLFCGVGRHGEFTLPSAQRRERRAWFQRTQLMQRISV
jgi:hypothetical protein